MVLVLLWRIGTDVQLLGTHLGSVERVGGKLLNDFDAVMIEEIVAGDSFQFAGQGVTKLVLANVDDFLIDGLVQQQRLRVLGQNLTLVAAFLTPASLLGNRIRSTGITLAAHRGGTRRTVAIVEATVQQQTTVRTTGRTHAQVLTNSLGFAVVVDRIEIDFDVRLQHTDTIVTVRTVGAKLDDIGEQQIFTRFVGQQCVDGREQLETLVAGNRSRPGRGQLEGGQDLESVLTNAGQTTLVAGAVAQHGTSFGRVGRAFDDVDQLDGVRLDVGVTLLTMFDRHVLVAHLVQHLDDAGLSFVGLQVLVHEAEEKLAHIAALALSRAGHHIVTGGGQRS